MSSSDPSSTEIKSDAEPWSTLENLVLAQAINKCGDTNWVAIARTIKSHPQIHRSNNFFSQKSCAIQYTQLLQSLEAETRSKQARGYEAKGDEPAATRLAYQLFHQRLQELKSLIQKDEERFRILVAELDDIRQGKWDNQLQEELTRNPPKPEAEPLVNGTESLSTADATQSKLKNESSVTNTIAASSLSTPSPSTSTPGGLGISRKPAISTEDLESKRASEPRDVEMEDMTVSTSSPLAAAVVHVATTPQTGEDIEMEDVINKELPSTIVDRTTPGNKEEELRAAEMKKDEATASIASSQTSASDLSPPDALEQEEDITPEDESVPSTEKTDHSVEVVKEEEEEVEEEEEKDRVKEVEEEEMDATLKKRLQTASARTEDEEEVEDLEHDEDTAHEGHSSADDGDEAASATRSGRRPKKIKTTVPIKRKRRGGRGLAIETEEGYNSSDSETTDSAHTNMSDQLMRTQMDDKKWKKILMMIWTDIANHRFGAVFMQPIKEQDAPGYYVMIKRPMDLKSIKERIRDGQITNADEFHRDVLLMFMNALMYNKEDSEVYQMALAMMNEAEFIIKNFKSSQSFAPTATGTGGSGNTSVSTTPTTRTAAVDAHQALSSATLSAGHSSRRRKSSGTESTPVE
ncbi:hypothetical protein BGX28_000508 [Mortierella sp. GBA30]|nr:hypothetical protein BGX28_000508 [Mortierella sp. GBA30]